MLQLSAIQHGLGRALRDQGRAAEAEAEAEAMFRQALALKEQGGATAISRGTTLHGLGCTILDQGRTAETEAIFHQAMRWPKKAKPQPGSSNRYGRTWTVRSNRQRDPARRKSPPVFPRPRSPDNGPAAGCPRRHPAC
jgi:hypothetical protein